MKGRGNIEVRGGGVGDGAQKEQERIGGGRTEEKVGA